jgi:hypothetical protein
MDTTIHPPQVHRLHYEMDSWPCDDLLTSFPCYIVTVELRRLIENVQPTGCRFADVEVTASENLRDRLGGRILPKYFWLQATGQAGRDDFGISSDYSLVISERMLRQIRRATLRDCEIAEFH